MGGVQSSFMTPEPRNKVVDCSWRDFAGERTCGEQGAKLLYVGEGIVDSLGFLMYSDSEALESVVSSIGVHR